jgi:hypothetical protein
VVGVQPSRRSTCAERNLAPGDVPCPSTRPAAPGPTPVVRIGRETLDAGTVASGAAALAARDLQGVRQV